MSDAESRYAWEDIDCFLDGCRAVFRRGSAEVIVDATHHDFFITGHGPRPLRLAASRRGLGEVVQIIDAHFGAGALHPDAVEGYVMDALVVAGRAVNPAIDQTFTAVDLVMRTPLVCCRGVVHNQHLLNDIVTFLPAAVAVSRIEEGEHRDGSVPERTEVWADALSRWRELYCAPGSSQRSVNRTLALFGEEASPDALWGLQHVVIDAPLPSVQHLEVLGCLGARHRPEAGPTIDAALQEAVLRASAEELGTALVLIDEGQLDRVVFGRDPPAMRLAEILSVISVHDLRTALSRRVRFDDILQNAIHALQDVLKLNVQTIEPPIPLPRDPKVKFLSTIGDILKEGVDMDHCVATRAPKALAGTSYIFHVSHDGAECTVEVSAQGRVLEARGPSNVSNRAIAFATMSLSVWGAPLRLAELGPKDTSLWTEPAPTLPSGFVPVTTIAELTEILSALLRAPFAPADDGVLAWAIAAAAAAAEGKRWFGVQRAAGLAFELCAHTNDGALQTTANVREGLARYVVLGDLGERDDDDEEWDLRT